MHSSLSYFNSYTRKPIIANIFETMQIFSFFVGALSIFCFALPSALTLYRAFHFISSLLFASFWFKNFLIVNVRSFFGLSPLLSLSQLASRVFRNFLSKAGFNLAYIALTQIRLYWKKADQSLRVSNISLFYSRLTLLPFPST